MTKVIYNATHGGFGISQAAIIRMKELGSSYISGDSDTQKYYLDWDIPRHDPILVKVVEELGKEVNDTWSDLRIIHITGKYRIDSYDGNEVVNTPESYNWVTP
jgi:hypothetical protein